jgi:DNA-binding NtrC family response regulator
MRNRTRMILLLEDECELSSIISESLGAKGAHVVSCATLTEVQFKLKNQVFDTIVFDLRVKGGTSLALIEQLHEARLHPDSKDFFTQNAHAPLIVVSGHLDVPTVKTIGKAVTKVMVKPCPLESLCSLIFDAGSLARAKAA